MAASTHFDPRGGSRMVDVGDKEVTVRRARASGRIHMSAETLRQVRQRQVAKGDVLEVARLAAIMAAKQTGQLIPLCHNVPLDVVGVWFEFLDDETIAVETEARATARTGVEMEALVAAAVAGLTIYDMCKSMDRAIELEQIRLEEKSGGQGGPYVRTQV